MDLDVALGLLTDLRRAVLSTRRVDGSPQMSPVVCALQDGKVVVSSRETAVKVKNLRRDPRASLCVFSDEFFGQWLQLDGEAEIVSLPEAMEGLIAYFRALSGEHPDWREYRRAMQAEQRVLIRLTVTRAAPDRPG